MGFVLAGFLSKLENTRVNVNYNIKKLYLIIRFVTDECELLACSSLSFGILVRSTIDGRLNFRLSSPSHS